VPSLFLAAASLMVAVLRASHTRRPAGPETGGDED